MVKVQVADDNFEFATQLSDYLTKDKGMDIRTTFDGEETIFTYLDFAPDVLILDLEMPKINGIQVLNKLCNLSYVEKNKCNVLIYSGTMPKYAFEYASKIYKVIPKPCNIEQLSLTVREIYENNKKPNYKNICKDTVLKLGFNINSKGTLFLVDAICMLKENDLKDFNMDFVYDCIAQKNRVSTRKVKWNIEKSINSMFRYSNNSKILSIFPEYDGRKPTPKYAIGLALNRLKDFD